MGHHFNKELPFNGFVRNEFVKVVGQDITGKVLVEFKNGYRDWIAGTSVTLTPEK